MPLLFLWLGDAGAHMCARGRRLLALVLIFPMMGVLPGTDADGRSPLGRTLCPIDRTTSRCDDAVTEMHTCLSVGVLFVRIVFHIVPFSVVFSLELCTIPSPSVCVCVCVCYLRGGLSPCAASLVHVCVLVGVFLAFSLSLMRARVSSVPSPSLPLLCSCNRA